LALDRNVGQNFWIPKNSDIGRTNRRWELHVHRSRAIFTCEIGSLVLEIAIFAIARVRIPGSLHSGIAMTTSGTWNLTGSAMLSSITVSVELSLFWFNFCF